MLAVVRDCVRRAARPPVTRNSGQRAHPTPSSLTGPLYPRRTNSSSIASRHGCYFPPPSPTVVAHICSIDTLILFVHDIPNSSSTAVYHHCKLLGCNKSLRRRFNALSQLLHKNPKIIALYRSLLKSPHTSSSFSASPGHCHDERKIADLMRRLAEVIVRLKGIEVPTLNAAHSAISVDSSQIRAASIIRTAFALLSDILPTGTLAMNQ
ncbi:hypothetical protein M422DRAFT_258409 [Sphaerobolus stellatus SS14]|uniref:Uncharacterized protein n=1 Tax=Sphaerobolus stellatus (strain SS14) TaxID=990650 RepID=A0A0C9U707_SPHS4|nr:hypothetical protein M422DRAFT_258409 [Sphaerobolus stellatus SS14]